MARPITTQTNPSLRRDDDAQRGSLPTDLTEAFLAADDPSLTHDQHDILEAMARLIDASGATGCCTLRGVATLCGWGVGGRVSYNLDRLHARGYLERTPHAPRSLRLSDKGWHATGRLSPAERMWREGYSAGRAAILAEMTTYTSAGTTAIAS